MGKVRHRKRTRDARISATAAPLVGVDSSSTTTASTDNALSTPGQQAKEKKGSKREQEITSLLDKLRSPESRERVWAVSTLSSLLLTLPPLQHRLLLSRNLIGLLIEKLTLPIPSSSATPPPPPSDDLTTSIESLGSLRNLAVSSPPHILSEMHNKRLLLPLTSIHLPLLAAYLPSVLGPAPAPLKPSLPATPAERERVELANEAQETLRQGYWDWAENVLVLLWSLAESNTKILASLNAHGEAIVGLCMSFLSEERIGIEKVGVEGAEVEGMEVEGGDKKKKGKKDAKEKGKKGGRVPLFVAVAAAQTLHAFLSSNPPSHTHLLASHGTGFSPSLHSLLSILLTPSYPSLSASSSSSSTSTNNEDWAQLRVLSFGSLLELAKSRSKRRDIETVRQTLRSEEAQSVLLSLVSSASSNNALHSLAEEAKQLAAQIDPTLLPSSRPKEGSTEAKLLSLERQAQTLQLGLEVLSEWLASGVPNSAQLAGGDVADEEEDEGMVGGEEDEEEWGGISMDMEGGDVGMDEDDEEGEDEDDGIIRKVLPGEGDDAMLDDLAATAAGDGSDSDEDDESSKPAAIKLLGGSLPLQLLALSQPTPLAFLPPAAFSSPLNRADAAPSGLIPSSTAQSTQLPSALSALSEALTTVSVRSVEALNNLYVTLARAKARRSVKQEVQGVFETVLALMHQALLASDAPAAAPPVVERGKKKKAGNGVGGGSGGEEVVDEVQERRMEVVMAGAGVVWGCVRLGLDPEAEEQLVIGPDTLPFLVSSLYPSAFAAAPTPAGEAIRVRVLGALGWLGRRRGVTPEENKQIGSFLLSLLPPTPSAAASATPASLDVAGTPDILLQAIDSFIDLYADEEREYDVPVFREGGMLQALEQRVAGVRAAVKKIDRNKFPELRSRADGAMENLVAFVGYRKEVVRPKGQGRRR